MIDAGEKEMTWRDLLNALKSATDEQLDGPIQIAPCRSSDDEPQEIQPAVCFGTVAELEFEASRAPDDNDHHPERLVLTTDHNGYALDGSGGVDLVTGRRVFPNQRVRDWTKAAPAGQG